MNRNTIKGFVIGVTATTIIGLGTNPALVSSFKKMAELTYKNIKITLNGSEITPKDANGNAVEPFIIDGNAVEPFIIDGSTYLPVRGVANVLDLDVTWDNNTNTVVLKSKTNQQLTEESKFSRKNPAPIGTAQTINVNNYSDKYTATITVKEAYRGDEAWTRIKGANEYASEPKDGKEYILAYVIANISDIVDDKSVSLYYASDFDVYSDNDVKYSGIKVYSTPDPTFYSSVYSGGTVEGWAIYEIDKTDPAPKVVFGENYDGTGGIWFKLTH